MGVGARQPVPVERSATNYVEQHWGEVQKCLYQGLPFAWRLRAIERDLQFREKLIKEGKLEDEFDWQSDLTRAQHDYAFNLDWISFHETVRDHQFQHWETFAKDTQCAIVRTGASSSTHSYSDSGFCAPSVTTAALFVRVVCRVNLTRLLRVSPGAKSARTVSRRRGNPMT
jgi:hypothetical protein